MSKKTEAQENFYKRIGRPIGELTLSRREQDMLYDKKWKKFLRRSRLFRHTPFVNVVFAAGSMALQNVHQSSDFDVIVGTCTGRIFTARLFCLGFCDIFNWRRKNSHQGHASDKLCFNHFVTSEGYCLQPPYNLYWNELYRNLTPVFGNTTQINEFWSKNIWLDEQPNFREDLRWLGDKPSLFRRAFEKILSASFGDFFEKIVKYFQIKKIQRSQARLTPGYKPRLLCSDTELEFHHDTKRIEEMVGDM